MIKLSNGCKYLGSASSSLEDLYVLTWVLLKIIKVKLFNFKFHYILLYILFYYLHLYLKTINKFYISHL